MRKSKMIQQISAYLDNELNNEEKAFVEGKIKSNEQWNDIYNQFRNLKNALKESKELPKNENLSYLIKNRIAEKTDLNERFLPVPKYLIPAATVLVLTAVIIFISYIFRNKNDIQNFISDNSKVVMDIYESNFGKNKFIPVANALSNEDVFNFAVYGYLPIDEKKEQVFQFCDDKNTGKAFEVGSISQKDEKTLKLANVYKELNIIDDQKEKIDSVLSSYRKNLEVSVLASPDKLLAVDEQIWDLNKALRYELSNNMNEKQKRFLFVSKGPSENLSKAKQILDSIHKKIVLKTNDNRNFIVFGNDTVIQMNIKMNYDSMIKFVYDKANCSNIFTNEFATAFVKKPTVYKLKNPKNEHFKSKPFDVVISQSKPSERTFFTVDAPILRVEMRHNPININEKIFHEIESNIVINQKNLNKLVKVFVNVTEDIVNEHVHSDSIVVRSEIILDSLEKAFKVMKREFNRKRDTLNNIFNYPEFFEYNYKYNSSDNLKRLKNKNIKLNRIMNKNELEKIWKLIPSIKKELNGVNIDSIIQSSLKGIKIFRQD